MASYKRIRSFFYQQNSQNPIFIKCYVLSSNVSYSMNSLKPPIIPIVLLWKQPIIVQKRNSWIPKRASYRNKWGVPDWREKNKIRHVKTTPPHNFIGYFVRVSIPIASQFHGTLHKHMSKVHDRLSSRIHFAADFLFCILQEKLRGTCSF